MPETTQPARPIMTTQESSYRTPEAESPHGSIQFRHIPFNKAPGELLMKFEASYRDDDKHTGELYDVFGRKMGFFLHQYDLHGIGEAYAASVFSVRVKLWIITAGLSGGTRSKGRSQNWPPS
ncbi:hypothetical protein Cob_v000371 [Colletotrichum orbiculare MAFF 240422]|uniref:Uncharacterized protein n=1 Tax=Colletotrichum orbiculare (strain 104-T / ATCC 96160 / CBS 514.97 / LARS 414 / MAFF 240422) TaxID=1213857 RepID=A0A484G7I2_COLOR|nr:hypothetical protein Cob_v000371 [Colletotrichum orbiculare MAFF 240422]